MTYYLIRHLPDGTEKTTPYTASGTRQAIECGQDILTTDQQAKYAQIKDRTGKVICTLLPPERPDSPPPRKMIQLEIF